MPIPIAQLDHLRIPLKEIQTATNKFSKENLIEEGEFVNVYKGELLRYGEKRDVRIRRFELKMEFLTEVYVLSRFKHPNIVSLIGFCDEENEKIIVTRHEAKGSLSNYLSDQTLTWIQRLKICYGVAKAIDYIHYVKGRDYSIIHQNITSDTILLDDDFEGKLSGFEYSITVSVDRAERYVPTVAHQNPGYTDPETLKPGVDVTQKSDIYSFGVLLSEIMGRSRCGRRAFLSNESEDNKPSLPINFYYAIGALDDLLIREFPDMWNQMGKKSCNRFVELMLACLTTDPVKRLSMKRVLIYLDHLHNTTPGTSTIQGVHIPRTPEKIDQFSKSKINKLAEVNKLNRIKLTDIQSATKCFSKKSELWSKDHYGLLYKGDLELFGNKYNVRILRIDNATAVDLLCKEIEILSTCKHDNIDSLLGFCDEEGSHMILVYEGNTYNHLSLLLEKKVLTWEMCLQICLNVAHGLNYLQNEMEDQKMVIHRQLSSHCIMLDDNWQKAKITGFGLSTFHENQDEVPLFEDYAKKGLLNGAGLRSMAPEISKRIDGEMNMAKATKKSDIYSFGVVMFEILCGASCTILRANDGEFRPEHWFKDRKIKQQVAEVLREENRGNKLFLKKGPNEDSLDTFIKIAEQCLAVNPEQRPTSPFIIDELLKAIEFQKNHKDPLRMSLDVIKLATGSFENANKIGSGSFGTVYKGTLAPEHGPSTIVAKRAKRLGKGDQQFKNELHILSEYRHENVIGLVGYNNDEQERIIVYEFAAKGSLDNYLNDASLTWINRLNICLDVARGLAFLHKGVRKHETVIHRDIKPANILLFDDWKAKVADFGLSLIYPVNDEKDYAIIHPNGTPRYLDPLYQKSGILTKESDIYSFGVVLLDILCGTSEVEVQSVKQCREEKRSDVVVFNATKVKILQQSLDIVLEVCFQCLHDDREKRPTAQDVLVELQKALELQVKAVPVSKES